MTKKALRGKKKAMIEALASSLGNVTASSRKIGVDRSLHYKWLELDENYKAWVMELPEIQVDYYETALNSLIKKGNVAAVIFALKAKGKNRGWYELKEQKIGFDLNKDYDEMSQIYNDIISKQRADKQPKPTGKGSTKK